jgi:hypothetical protein
MTIDNKTITLQRIKELVRFGNIINALVTAEWCDYHQQMVIHIQDLEFREYIHAALYLQHIQSNQIPNDYSTMLV